MDRKLGWTEKGIIGMVFLPIGALFMALGLILYAVKAGDDPKDPLIFLCVFGGMGLLFSLIGLILLECDFLRRRALLRALEGGECVMAKIVGIRQRTNINVNGTHPSVVECHYRSPDTGEMHVCFSRYLYFDPTDMLTADEVPVYLDRTNDKVAFVDIDAVLPKVVVHR